MALSARREIHESWISRKRDRCLLAFPIPNHSISTSATKERMTKKKAENSRERERGGRQKEDKVEGTDLQSGRYLQVKSSHRRAAPRRLERDVRRVDRIIRRIEGIRFASLSRVGSAPSSLRLSRSNFTPAPAKTDRALRKRSRGRRPRVNPCDYAIFFRRLPR